MNCRAFEPLIALYAGRDLDDSKQVEEHLSECAECRQLLEDLQSSRAALKEWALEPVDAGLLAAVRSGVLAGVNDRPRMVGPWVAAAGAVAALLIVFVATPRQPAVEPTRPAPPIARSQARMDTPPVEVKAPILKRKRIARRSEEPLVVKMLTDDPDIVVIWLVDRTGD